MLSTVLDTQDTSISTQRSEADLWNVLDKQLGYRLADDSEIESVPTSLEGVGYDFVDPETLSKWIKRDRMAELPPYDVLFPWLHSYSTGIPVNSIDRTIVIRSRQILNDKISEDSGILKNSLDPSDLFVSWSDSMNRNMLKFYPTNKSILDNLTTIKEFIKEMLLDRLEIIDWKLSGHLIDILIMICIHFKIMPFLKTDIQSIKQFCDSNSDRIGINISNTHKYNSEELWKQHTNSFRRFDLQCTKMLEMSSRIVTYCYNNKNHIHGSVCRHCKHFILLLNFALSLLRTLSNNSTSQNHCFILQYENSNLIPHTLIGTPPMTITPQTKDDLTTNSFLSNNDIILFNNWDRAFKIHEKLEMAKVSSRSCIDTEHSFWCGNTTDYKIIKYFSSRENTIGNKYFTLENEKQNVYYSPDNSITTLPEISIEVNENEDVLINERKLFNIPFIQSNDKTMNEGSLNLFIRCSENAALLSVEKLWELLTETLSTKTAKDIMISFPSSGSIGLGSLNISSVGGILNTCYFMYLISKKTKLKTLLHSRDGYTEISFLLIAYLIFLWDLSLEDVIFKLNEDCKRPFYLFQSDMHVLGHLQLLFRSFSPKREEKYKIYDVYGQDKVPNPLDIDSEMFSNVFFIQIPKTNIDLNKLNGPLPSRILDHLYLGSLEHAQSPALLNKLGITHIVSVGETVSWVQQNCTAVPETRNRGMTTVSNNTTARSTFRGQRSATITNTDTSILSCTTAHRFLQDGFNILKINNLQDNGCDRITEQLTEILNFIDEAYTDNSKVLVHCMVGVSRSATVCIAECMKRLRCDLIKAYLYVRVRRLNIIIQPNLMFMYELLKWQEVLNIDREMEWHIICRNILELNKRYV